eukprot:Blabericola_migrator_1__6661@NODE_3361_length_1831_cov_36_912698_g2097_i0_p2_GENE_NODE_3361_length_1831_cov_36_912698_g2097_i0NODE_3361_length_1831_cov_36_912698_g2097_i0_p2_ORF_typecomplete_len166_score32_59DUF3498/PF12004_8/0_025FAM76/PF16046_5/0_43_NODE_3361_length_1831_cov_36_912698_g2097_i038535
MWRLVSSAVKEFSLALQELPREEGEDIGDVFQIGSSPFAQVVNGPSPDSSDLTDISPIIQAPAELQIVSPVSELPQPERDPTATPVPIHVDEELSKPPSEVQQHTQRAHQQPNKEDSKTDEVWLVRRLEAEVEVLKSRLDQAHTLIATVRITHHENQKLFFAVAR